MPRVTGSTWISREESEYICLESRLRKRIGKNRSEADPVRLKPRVHPGSWREGLARKMTGSLEEMIEKSWLDRK